MYAGWGVPVLDCSLAIHTLEVSWRRKHKGHSPASWPTGFLVFFVLLFFASNEEYVLPLGNLPGHFPYFWFNIKVFIMKAAADEFCILTVYRTSTIWAESDFTFLHLICSYPIISPSLDSFYTYTLSLLLSPELGLICSIVCDRYLFYLCKKYE